MKVGNQLQNHLGALFPESKNTSQAWLSPSRALWQDCWFHQAQGYRAALNLELVLTFGSDPRGFPARPMPGS